VANDDAGSARGAGDGATVTSLCLNAGDNGSFWHGVDGQDIADLQGRFLAGVAELSGVHALNGDEVFSALLVFVLISENNLGERSTPARIVNDILDNALHVALTFSEVQGSEFCRCHSVVSMSCKDSAASVSLGSDASSHD